MTISLEVTTGIAMTFSMHHTSAAAVTYLDTDTQVIMKLDTVLLNSFVLKKRYFCKSSVEALQRSKMCLLVRLSNDSVNVLLGNILCSFQMSLVICPAVGVYSS
jgi:hypothetical protein